MTEQKFTEGESGRSLRAKGRREQILDAASECFAREGFHGASIARISKMSGISPGHIYHFFDNKEAIVKGIVERMATRWLELLQPYPTNLDVVPLIAERSRIAARERTRTDFVGLWLEVLAETARNTPVAQAVNDADQSIRTAIAEQVRYIRAARGVRNDTPIEAIIEVVLALFEGLTNRSVANREFKCEALDEVMMVAIRAALEA
jgi:AcrR family transcriptional regulator